MGAQVTFAAPDSTTAVEGAVTCATGLVMVQRDAGPAPAGPAFSVAPVAPVSTPDTAPVAAQRADGSVWRRHWSEPDRLVIEFVDLTTVEVLDEAATVTFDRPLEAEMEQHLLLDHVLPLVLARRGALVLHGGVISRSRRGVVLVGATGAGKSTLVAHAWQRGWTVGGDDGAVLHLTDPPTVEPTYATIRLTPSGADLLGIDPASGTAVTTKVRIAGPGAQAFSRAPVPLAAIAILEPIEAGATAVFEALDGVAAHARLFGATFHADLSREHLLPGVLEGLAIVVESCPVGRLHVPRGIEGLAAAEAVLRGLVGESETGSVAREGSPG